MSEVITTPSANVTGSVRSASSPILSVRNVEKVFGGRQNLMYALAGVSFDVARGEFVAIMGPSGSGKTTLLNCISTIDRPSSGRILINDSDITTMSKSKLSAFRRDELGFIFQDSNLLDTLTGMENIALALTIKGARPASITQRIEDIARTLNVTDSLKQYPGQMSGGQKQRVAAARAIVADPSLILADEPTGALDSRNATIMLETLSMLNKSLNATILMVTHDAYAASFSDRVLFLSDGKLFNEIRQGSLTREEYFARIMEVVTFLGGEAYHAA
ncbi:MAG: ABC transporter ATP-binding protein [Coriobacteriales bacterium]